MIERINEITTFLIKINFFFVFFHGAKSIHISKFTHSADAISETKKWKKKHNEFGNVWMI